MPEFRNKEELEERIRMLEKENALLAENAEDTLMLGLVSEAIEQEPDVSGMLNLVLERVSMLKDIPLVACCSMDGNIATVIASYLSFTHESMNAHHFSLPTLDSVPTFMGRESPMVNFLRGTDIFFAPNKVLLIPFSTHAIPHGVYLFADRGEDSERLDRFVLPLKRITNLLTLSMDNRNLLIDYKQLNNELDQRVQERSKDLIESDHKYRALVEGSDTAIMLLGDGYFTDCNQATLDMFKCQSKDEFVKVHPGMLSPELQPEGIDSMTLANQRIATAMEKGSNRFDWLHQRLDGEIFPADVHLARVEINHKTMIQAVVIDNSERVSAEFALRESEEKYRNIIENMQDCYYRTDVKGRLVFASPSIQSMMCCEPDEMIGDKLSDYYIDPTERQKLLALMRASPDGRVDNFEAQIRRKDGEVIWLSASSHFIYNHAGTILGVEGTLRDMTALKQMEENFNQAQKMETIGTLVGGIAHDFNNILASMVGSLFLLKRKLADQPELIQTVESLENQSFRAADMIKQMLTFARKGHVDMQPLAFSALMKEVFKLTRRTIPENISVSMDVCADALSIKGDASQLQQVLMNLMNNARDAVAKVGRPEIKSKIDVYQADDAFVRLHPDIGLADKFARLRVSDNGCGIAKDQLQHVFEPFYTTKGVGEGTGLGLAMIYGAIQSHHGIIDVDSDVGAGTVFSVYLPLLSEDESQPVKEVVEVLSGAGETLLLVDDEDAVREVSVALLENLGYTVLQAEDGVQAMAILADEDRGVDLLLTDVVMPNMGGVELAKRVWQQQPSMPIVFMSGYDQNRLANLPHQVGRMSILQKPFSITELSHQIHILLNPK